MANRKPTAPKAYRKSTKTISPMINGKTTAPVNPSDPADFWAANAEKMKRGEPTSIIGLVVKKPSSNLPGSAGFHHPHSPTSKMVIPTSFPPRQSEHTIIEVKATRSESSGVPATIDDAHTWPAVVSTAVPVLLNESISVSSSKSSGVSEPVVPAGTSPIATTIPFLAPIITSDAVIDSPSLGIPKDVEPNCTSLVVASTPALIHIAKKFLTLSEASSAAPPKLRYPAFMESDSVPLTDSMSSPVMTPAPLRRWASDLESSDNKVPDLVIIPEVNSALLDEEPPFPSKPAFDIDAEPEAHTVLEPTSLTLPETTSPAAPVATHAPVYVATWASTESSRPLSPVLDDAEFPALSSSVPVLPSTYGPKYLSNEIIQKLQAAPPPPPRPDLNTAIRNGGFTVRSSRINASKSSTGPKSQVVTCMAKTAVIPIINPKKDARLIGSRAQRQVFANGRDLPVFLGSKKLSVTVPEYMYRQCSTSRNALFIKTPSIDCLTFAEESVNETALVKFATWMNDICFSNSYFMINFTDIEDLENVELCHAAHVLDLNPEYSGHICRRLIRRIRDTAPSDELITTVTNRFGSNTDTIYNVLVDNLAYHLRRRSGTRFTEVLTALPELAAAVSKKGDKPPKRRH